MAKLTKASFARAKTALGIKKVTKKNIGRIARKARGLGRKVTRSTGKKKSSGKRGGVRKLARRRWYRRKRRGGGKSMIRTAFKLIRLGALVAPALARAKPDLDRGDYLGGAMIALQSFAGIRREGNFDAALLTQMWTPYVMTSLITHGVPKLTSTLRRL